MNIYTADQTVATTTAGYLLDIGAVKLNPQQPFTWASGWKSPIYCDNRMTLSYPGVRSYIKEHLANLVNKHFHNADCIAGVATAGIPQGALIADALQKPFSYVRSKPKDHGMENMIEGRVETGQRVVVVEDLISTGGSSLKAVDALRQASCEVLGMVAIFTYGFALAEENFAKSGIKLFCLSNYDVLIKVASEKGYIQPKDMESLEAWRKDPSAWKPDV